MTTRIAPADYERLKAFCRWMWDHTLDLTVCPEEARPANVLAEMERRSPSAARKGLATAIGDMVELFQDLSPDAVRAIDNRLAAEGISTLSEVRAGFERGIRRIIRRGAIRNETEYYALRNVVEHLSAAESSAAWAMLAAFEQRVGSSGAEGE